MCHLILGDTKDILTMFVRKKKYPSGNIGVIVVEKIGGKMKELATIGVAYNEDEVENLVNEAKEWISKEESRRHPQLDLYGEEREACDREREEVRRVLSNVSNITTDVPAHAKGIYSVTGVKQTQQWNELPAGIYIVDGVKRVKK